ncbi:succinic semialdehyde dehydrogenase [Natronosalvus rutilus]|uniref:Succinic semialdehyde dehydrogenase n=1 Tax=Natronosalvus rutilus TaxID=2953753 RepID=A0A9E7SX11_9EURY|nr:succinic semialdehyde dehydrogenase [Natronosalvus rutilus]UTF53698.1 succinic semialdehyde dehydrogenase [Natronosalvus rutilus]
MTSQLADSVLSSAAVTTRDLETLADRIETSEAASIPVRAPATDEVVSRIPACSEADVESAVERARTAQSEWATRDPKARAAVLDRFADLVLERRERLLDLIQIETGKSRVDAAEEVLDVPATAAYYATRGPDLLADESRDGVFPLLTDARVTYDPVGVVGVISPWNYPLTLAITDAIPALLAGNGVVLKPDEKTPFVALELAALLEEAGLPPGVFEIVTGEGSTVGPALIDRADYLSFTGSTATGRSVAERAGRNLIDCSLELGGKNPMVVLADADPETAARGAVQGCFANAGQLCLAMERIYVEAPRYEAFLDAFVRETRALSLGTGLEYGPDVGSLIDGDQLERVEAHVADALERGASILTGGRARPDVGPFCYEPTILTDVAPDSMAACEETFGPVVSVEPVPSAGRAVEAANKTEYGLNASVWTGDRRRGIELAREIDAGTVCVNDAYISGWAATDAPMGGVGDSGLGRRHGPEGLERYLESKTIASSRVGPVWNPPGVPARWFVRGMVGALGVRKRLSRWFR